MRSCRSRLSLLGSWEKVFNKKQPQKQISMVGNGSYALVLFGAGENITMKYEHPRKSACFVETL